MPMDLTPYISERIAYRRDHLGWFVASTLYFILTQHLLIDGLVLTGLFLPLWVGIIFFFISLSGIFALVHSAARTFAPTEDLQEAVQSNRTKSVLAVILIGFGMWALGYISYTVLNVPANALRPYMWMFGGILLLLVVLSGWDSGRLRNAVNRMDPPTEEDSIEFQSPLRFVFGRETKGNFWVLFSFTLSTSIISAIIFQNILAAITTLGSLFTLLQFIKSFHPDI